MIPSNENPEHQLLTTSAPEITFFSQGTTSKVLNFKKAGMFSFFETYVAE
jgi:hypothetical protein